MKSYPIILLFLLSLFVFSCSDSLTDIGSGVQPISDQIKVGTDTFHLTTTTVPVEYINSRPDSFLLGSFYDTKFGSTKADILAQVNCPVGFKYPSNAVADSAVVIMYYKTWVGSKYSPLDINIYQMNLNTFKFSDLFHSNLNPSEYTDQTIKLGQKIFSAKDAAIVRKDSTAIRFKLSNSFVSTFGNDSYYSSTNAFLNFFKGMYITANYGASTMLTIRQIDLLYYYHYTYLTKNIHGGDSLVTVNDVRPFPANSEVRQVNHFVHDRSTVNLNRDTVNYIASPANFQTRINVPLNRIKQRMDAGVKGKDLSVNSALLKVEVTEQKEDTAAKRTAPTYLLLIKESAKKRFFDNRELPSDTCAIQGSYTTEQIGTTGTYKHYYSFNMSTLVANEFKLAKQKGTTLPESMNMLLVPIKISTTTNSSGVTSYIYVKENHLMNAVTIRSGKVIDPNKDKVTAPMMIKVVYSGF